MRFRRAAAVVAVLLASALARAEAVAERPAGKYEEARAAAEAKDFARAEKLANELIAADPKDASAWNLRGAVRDERGDMDGAIGDVERAIALRDEPKFRYNAALYELERKRYAPARDHARRCVELDPTKAPAWALLADLEMINENEKGGLAAINEALRLDPKDEMVRGRADLILRFMTEKYPGFAAALAQHPKEALDHHAKGGELAEAEKWKEAIAEWEAALKVDPSFADCHYNIGLASDRLGDLERAEKEYLLAVDGFRPEEKLLKADALNNLVYVRVRRGKAGKEDVARVREAIALDRERPSKLDTLGRACDAAGDRACARDAFAKVAATREQVPAEIRRYAEERVRALGATSAPTSSPAR